MNPVVMGGLILAAWTLIGFLLGMLFGRMIAYGERDEEKRP